MTVAAGRALRRQLAEGFVLSAGCFDAWSARLAQEAGFTSLHFSGGAFNIAQYAHAGVIYTMPEVASQVGRITAAVDIPLLSDIDTGFGDFEDIMRTVREIERSGAGGVHIEDVPFPMTLQSDPRRDVVDQTQAVARVRAAVAARRAPEFLIVGRTDSTHSLEDQVERCNRFLQAGADVAFPITRRVQVGGSPLCDLPRSDRLEAMHRLVAEIDGPVLTVGGVDPDFTAADLRSAGFAWVILPLVALEAATGAMLAALSQARDDGLAAAYFAENPGSVRDPAITRLLGSQLVLERERAFLGTPDRDPRI